MPPQIVQMEHFPCRGDSYEYLHYILRIGWHPSWAEITSGSNQHLSTTANVMTLQMVKLHSNIFCLHGKPSSDEDTPLCSSRLDEEMVEIFLKCNLDLEIVLKNFSSHAVFEDNSRIKHYNSCCIYNTPLYSACHSINNGWMNHFFNRFQSAKRRCLLH